MKGNVGSYFSRQTAIVHRMKNESKIYSAKSKVKDERKQNFVVFIGIHFV